MKQPEVYFGFVLFGLAVFSLVRGLRKENVHWVFTSAMLFSAFVGYCIGLAIA